MKVVFVILAVAMMSQASLAGVIGRLKRGAAEDSFSYLLKFINSAAVATGPLAEFVLKEMPKTPAYDKYKIELEAYLADYHTYKTTKAICVQKSTELLEKFVGIFEEYQKEDAPAEAKKVNEISERYESEDLDLSEETLLKIVSSVGELNKIEDLDEDERTKVLLLILEVC